MNKEWSELNKKMQTEFRKEISFASGINTLLELRSILFETVRSFFEILSNEDFSAMPYLNADGYHNKTVAYSIWHIFRIEDIIANSLINDIEQVFCSEDNQKRMNADIITTGNELTGVQIAEFSRGLDLNKLYAYASEVKEQTEAFLKNITHQDLKKKIEPTKRQYLQSLHVVSEDPNASWLIDYWCDKDLGGLIRMSFSRHWIMHIEASLRIIWKLNTSFNSLPSSGQ